jgi:putative ATP-dependent endonuclease of OLD family
MYISKVEIYNFRSHKNTLVELSENNVLIGQNNTGKTAFLDAVNYAIGMMRKGIPTEDDFYASGWVWNKGGTLNHTLLLVDYV